MQIARDIAVFYLFVWSPFVLFIMFLWDGSNQCGHCDGGGLRR